MSAREWIVLAARLWPNWTWQRRRRWIRHARYASHCAPAYAKLLPMTQDQITPHERVFAPHTLREAAR